MPFVKYSYEELNKIWGKKLREHRHKILDECFKIIFNPPYKPEYYNYFFTLFCEMENTIVDVISFNKQQMDKTVNKCLDKIYKTHLDIKNKNIMKNIYKCIQKIIIKIIY
tara:strand:+ start:973 stop:1302 length:330 start_codon:yes stop_codon:yes gene_type:complete